MSNIKRERSNLVSETRFRGDAVKLQWDRWPPVPLAVAGARSQPRSQPSQSLGPAAARHERPNSRLVRTAADKEKLSWHSFVSGRQRRNARCPHRPRRCLAAIRATAAGIAQLAQFCKTNQVSLVVMEATGGYERLPFAQLWAADMPVALVNPRSVRRFAEAMGALEKTDKIDTGMIAWYAETKHIGPTPPASDKQQRFMALVLRMRQLTDLRTAQDNQRRLVDDPDALASFSTIVATINRQIRTLEAKVIALIDADPLGSRWIRRSARSRVSPIERWPDCSPNLPEIGTLSGKAVANSPASRQSPKIAARRVASALCAADARRYDCYPLYSCRTRPAARAGLQGVLRYAARSRESAKGGAHRAGTQAAGAAECQGARRAKAARANGLTREGHNSAVEATEKPVSCFGRERLFLRPGLTNR